MTERPLPKNLTKTALTDIESTDVEGVGRVVKDHYGRYYRWVKNRNATAFTAGQPVCYDVTNAGSDAIHKSVNSPVTADLMMNAGIAMTAIAASGGNCYGWIMIHGYYKDARVLEPTTAAIVVGEELIAVNAKTYLFSATAPGTAPIYSNHFIAMETLITETAGGATSTTRDVFVKCLF